MNCCRESESGIGLFHNFVNGGGRHVLMVVQYFCFLSYPPALSGSLRLPPSLAGSLRPPPDPSGPLPLLLSCLSCEFSCSLRIPPAPAVLWYRNGSGSGSDRRFLVICLTSTLHRDHDPARASRRCQSSPLPNTENVMNKKSNSMAEFSFG